LAVGASFYGVLLGAVGAGAIGGAILLPRLRDRFDADGLLFLSGALTAAVMALLALPPPQWLAIAILLVLGMAWIVALTTPERRRAVDPAELGAGTSARRLPDRFQRRDDGWQPGLGARWRKPSAFAARC
jgi:predicted MFS family arabinose efflux permease